MAWKIMQGDVRAMLSGIPEKSVHCVVTSPPYWGLRDYGLPPSVWGGEPECEHEWEKFIRPGQSGGKKSKKVQIKGQENFQIVPDKEQSICRKCGAWFGCLGLEPTPELYVKHMVEIFRGVWRVLRDDGVVWLNLGSSMINKTIESNEMVLRNDLTKEEVQYVLEELLKYAKQP
jgi:DNA modification methylase